MNASEKLFALDAAMPRGPWVISSAGCRCCWLGPPDQPQLFEGPDTSEDGIPHPSVVALAAYHYVLPELAALAAAAESVAQDGCAYHLEGGCAGRCPGAPFKEMCDPCWARAALAALNEKLP
jgi:hypothetical protein